MLILNLYCCQCAFSRQSGSPASKSLRLLRQVATPTLDMRSQPIFSQRILRRHVPVRQDRSKRALDRSNILRQIALGELLLPQPIPLNHPHLPAQLDPLLPKLLQHLINIQCMLPHNLLILLARPKRSRLPLPRPLLDHDPRNLALALHILRHQVETRLVLVRRAAIRVTRLEQLDLRELAEQVEQTQAVPRLGLVQQHNHAAADLDPRQRQRQLRRRQAVRLAVLAVRADERLVGPQHAALDGDEVEQRPRADQLWQEARGVRVVLRDVVGHGEPEVRGHEGDVGRVEGEALALDEDGDAAELVAQGDADRFGGGVEGQGLLDEAAGRKAEGEDGGAARGQGEDGGGGVHFVGDGAHHVHEVLACLAVGVVGVVLLLLEVLVAFGAVPALGIGSWSVGVPVRRGKHIYSARRS